MWSLKERHRISTSCKFVISTLIWKLEMTISYSTQWSNVVFGVGRFAHKKTTYATSIGINNVVGECALNNLKDDEHVFEIIVCRSLDYKRRNGHVHSCLPNGWILCT